eukprot:TRINITY_DN3321_c0_g1_i1.p1 TRINITY_DN3321_c0_g1~~TRINITY_DN3321_c0_g1_i1.p1  ORF type:complete len:1329 (-),score=276.45 TRINITY_DN3321_c0_g1_i1:158-4144(-)
MASFRAFEGAATSAACNRALMFEPLARSPSPLGRGRATPPLPTWPGAPRTCSPGPLRWRPLSPSAADRTRQSHPGAAMPVTSRFARSSSPAPRNEPKPAGYVFPMQLTRSSSPVRCAPPVATVKPVAVESAAIGMPSLLGQMRQLAASPGKEGAIQPSVAAPWVHQKPRSLQPPSGPPDALAASLPASPWMTPRPGSPQRGNSWVPVPCEPCRTTPRWMNPCLEGQVLLEPGTWPQRHEQRRSRSPEAACAPLGSLARAQLRCPSEPPMPCLAMPPDAKQQTWQQQPAHQTDAAVNSAQEPTALPRGHPAFHHSSVNDKAFSAPGIEAVIDQCQRTKDQVGDLTALLKLLEGDVNSIRRENLELRLAMQQRLSGRSRTQPGSSSLAEAGQKQPLAQDSGCPEKRGHGSGLQQPSWSFAVHPGLSRHGVFPPAERVEVITTEGGQGSRTTGRSLLGDCHDDREEAQCEQLDRLLAAQKAAEAAAIARQEEQQFRDLLADEEVLKRTSEEKEAALKHDLEATMANAKCLERKVAQEAAEARDLERQLADACRRNQELEAAAAASAAAERRERLKAQQAKEAAIAAAAAAVQEVEALAALKAKEAASNAAVVAELRDELADRQTKEVAARPGSWASAPCQGTPGTDAELSSRVEPLPSFMSPPQGSPSKRSTGQCKSTGSLACKSREHLGNGSQRREALSRTGSGSPVSEVLDGSSRQSSVQLQSSEKSRQLQPSSRRSGSGTSDNAVKSPSHQVPGNTRRVATDAVSNHSGARSSTAGGSHGSSLQLTQGSGSLSGSGRRTSDLDGSSSPASSFRLGSRSCTLPGAESKETLNEALDQQDPQEPAAEPPAQSKHWRKLRCNYGTAAAFESLLHRVRRENMERLYEQDDWTKQRGTSPLAVQGWKKVRNYVGACNAFEGLLRDVRSRRGVRGEDTPRIYGPNWQKVRRVAEVAVTFLGLLHRVRETQSSSLYDRDWNRPKFGGSSRLMGHRMPSHALGAPENSQIASSPGSRQLSTSRLASPGSRYSSPASQRRGNAGSQRLNPPVPGKHGQESCEVSPAPSARSSLCLSERPTSPAPSKRHGSRTLSGAFDSPTPSKKHRSLAGSETQGSPAASRQHSLALSAQEEVSVAPTDRAGSQALSVRGGSLALSERSEEVIDPDGVRTRVVYNRAHTHSHTDNHTHQHTHSHTHSHTHTHEKTHTSATKSGRLNVEEAVVEEQSEERKTNETVEKNSAQETSQPAHAPAAFATPLPTASTRKSQVPPTPPRKTSQRTAATLKSSIPFVKAASRPDITKVVVSSPAEAREPKRAAMPWGGVGVGISNMHCSWARK